MPCNDITDILKIVVDNDDHIVRYGMEKQSCGSAVGGQGRVRKWLYARNVDQVLAATTGDFLIDFVTDDPIEEYLYLKHFLAAKKSLEILLGRESGSKENYCTVDTVRHGPKGMEIVVLIKSDLMTDEIQACGNCCSSSMIKNGN